MLCGAQVLHSASQRQRRSAIPAARWCSCAGETVVKLRCCCVPLNGVVATWVPSGQCPESTAIGRPDTQVMLLLR